MTLAYLKQYKLVYLCSAYTRQPDRDEACRQASVAAGVLMRAGVRVFSPIAHSHTIAIQAGLDPLDEVFWSDQDRPLQDACGAIVILKMPGWEESAGISSEVAHAALMGQDVYGLEPETFKLTKWGFG